MTPILLTGPAVEPVTLADIKNYLRIDHYEDDRLLNSLITAARLLVEAESGRCLISQIWRLVLNRWPGAGMVRLPLSPILELEQVRVFHTDGSPIVVPKNYFHLDKVSEPAQITQAIAWPMPGKPFSGIEIDIKVGYGPSAIDVPMPLQQAIRMIVARWYEHRGDNLKKLPTIPSEALALVAPYRRRRL